MPTQEDAIRELYRRRESLAGTQRMAVEELAKRFKVSDQQPVDQVEQTRQAFESQAPMSITDKFVAAAKQLGAAIDPRGLIDAGGSVVDFLKNPIEWSKNHFDASRAQFAPGASDPVNEAAAGLVPMAVGLAAGDMAPVARKAGGKVADFATSEPIVKGLKRSSEGAIVGSAMGMNVPGVVAGATARVGAEMLDRMGKRRRAAGAAPTEAPAPKGTSIPVEGPDVSRGTKAGEPAGGVVSPAGAETPQPTQSPAQPQQSTPLSPAQTSPPKPVGKMKAQEIADRMIDKLVEWDVSPKEAEGFATPKQLGKMATEFGPAEVAKMTSSGWTRLAKEAGLLEPGQVKANYLITDSMRTRVIEGLRRRMAGPERTGPELIEHFKKSGKPGGVK